MAVTSANTGRDENATVKQRPIISYDWEPTYVKYFTQSQGWNENNSCILGFAHGLRDKYALLFNTPYQGGSDGGLNDGKVYYVQVVNSNTISLHTSSNLGTQVALSALQNTHGPARLGLVYKVEKLMEQQEQLPLVLLLKLQIKELLHLLGTLQMVNV